MAELNSDRERYGPEPAVAASGVGAVHRLVYERAAGHAIASIYMGVTSYRDWLTRKKTRSEYLGFEFTDGTALVLTTEDNRFSIAMPDEAQAILRHAKGDANR